MVTDEQKTIPTIREVSPCAFCPPEEKYLACHDTCKKFAEWKNKVDAVKKKKREYYKSLPKYMF
jgi:hypothetical protein